MQPVLLLLIFPLTLAAQTNPAPRPTPPPAPPTTFPSNSTPDLNRRSTVGMGPTFDANTELAVSGKVLLPTRQPPPEPVPLEFKCRGTAATEWTNAKGNFAIPTGLANVDPLASGGMPSFGDCVVRLRMVGFEEATFKLDKVRNLKDLDLGTIVLRPVASSGLTVFSATSAAAPESARRLYIRGMEKISSREFEEALSALEKAARAYPQFAAAHQLRGQILERMQRREAARAAYEKSAEIDPSYVKPLLQLAEMAAEDQDPENALAWAAKVTRLAPTQYPNIHFVEGASHFNMNHFEQAEQAARAGLAADPGQSFPRLHKLLGESLYRRNAYKAALAAYREYLKSAEGSPDAPEIQARITECERLARILNR